MTVERITVEWHPIYDVVIGRFAGHLYLVGREADQFNLDGYAISAHPADKSGFGSGQSGQTMGGSTIEISRWDDLGANESWNLDYGRLLGQTWDAYLDNLNETEASRGAVSISIVLPQGTNIDQLWQDMVDYSQLIHESDIEYHAVFPAINSNSVIATVLSNFGIDIYDVLPASTQEFIGANTLIGTKANDTLYGFGNDDLFYVSTGGSDVFYGGNDSKTFFNIFDGLDKIKFASADEAVVSYTDFGDGETGWTYFQRIDSEVSAGTLYSIERFSGARLDLLNKIDMSTYNSGVQFKDQSATEIQSIQQNIDPDITSSLRMQISPTDYAIVDNFGTFVGTNYNDSFVLNVVLGRHFDGDGGANLLSYKSLVDARGVKIDVDLGTVVIVGSDQTSGPGAPIVDVFKNFAYIEGSNHGDIIYGSEGGDYLFGLAGDDIFVGGEGGDWFYGGYGRDTVDYGQEEAAGGTFDVRVMNVDDFSADVRVFDTYGFEDNLRDVETIVLTDGNDTVTYSHAVVPNVLTINGGDGQDSFTFSADTYFGYVQKSGNTWNFYDSYGGNDYKLTLLNFENVYFSSSEDQQIPAVILPDLGQSSLNPINVFVSEGGNSSFSGTIDYTASSSGGSFHFGNGSQNNTAHVGGVTHIMKTPSVIYMPDHHNSIIVDDESTLVTVYTGTASDIVHLYTTQPTIYYSGGNDTYFMNAGYNQVRMAGNLTSDNIINVQGELFGETESHITITLDVGFLNLYVPYLSYGTHYSIEIGQGYVDIVGGLDGEVTYQFVGSTDTPAADFGTWGNDVISGGDFSDYLTGSGGNDTLYGGNNADALYGGDGDDILYGGSGDDQLYGGFGNDALYGGSGNDVLRGGWGDDVYVFTPGGGVEDIFDPDGYNSLKVKGGVPPENVTFVQSGNDLLINVASGVILRGYYSGTTSISEIIFENDAGEVTHTYTVEAMLNGEHLASNTAPVAQDDVFTAPEGQTVTGNVLAANGHGADSDTDNDPLTVVPAEIVTAGGGSVLLLSNGDFIYTPLENFNGADSFTYTLEDGQGDSDTGTVFLNMTPVNDAPEARDDRFTGTENIEIEGNLLADNGFGADFDLEGDQLRVVQDMVTSAAGGSVILMHNGDFVYMPPANFYGEDSFTYTMSDGNGGEATATAFITLEPGNLAPVALNDYDSGFLLGTIGGNVLADNGQGADYDPDGDPLSVMPEGFMTANGGLVMLQANGDYTYTPVAGFTGTDSFTYTLIDGQGGSAVATVNLSVGLRGNEITGSERGDFILGTQQSDVILAKGGNDFVLGRQSADKILGGAGKDFIHGQNGDDLLIGGSGSDQLYGGNGNDILIGDDVLIIGSGAGTRYMQAGSGGEGDCLDGGNGNDLLIGGAGNDTLSGGNGADVFKFLSGANGKDRITDFDAREGDKIDISDVLEGGYDPLADMISQFAKIEKQGHTYTLSIDADGSDNGAHFTAIAVIDSNRHISLESMIQNGNLIV